MTLEERLECLTGRHEALTQSVESLTHDVRELRAGIESLKTIAETSLATLTGWRGSPRAMNTASPGWRAANNLRRIEIPTI
jgi:hypothetical protein